MSPIHCFFQFWRYPAFLSDILLLIAVRAGLWGSRVRIGPATQFRGWPLFAAARGSQIVIGPRARLASRTEDTALGVAHRCVFRTLRTTARLSIGSDFRASGVTLCAATSIVIGDRVVIGADALIVDTDFHALDPERRSPVGDDILAARCTPVQIGDDVFIGARAIILKGAILRQGVVVGAGAVVTGTIEPFSIVAGNPARVIGFVRKPT